MSLQVWLPLTKDLRNQGLSNVTVTNNGATFNSAGKLGGCYTFDGTDDFINLGNISSYFTGSTHPFSICFWIYSSESGTRGVIFSSYGLTSTSNFFSLEINSGSVTNNSLRFDWKASPDWASDIILTPNIWIHVGITYDGTSVRFYKNGDLVQTKKQTLSSLSTSNNWYLGRDNRTGTTAFNGRFNDVRIYDHCLSEKEVKEIFNGLILHYPLNNNGTVMNYSEIGNLIPNSKTMALGAASSATGTWRLAGTSNMTRERVLVQDSPIGECYVFQNEGIQTANDGSCYGIDSTTYFEPNSEYRISMFARTIAGSEGYAGYNIYNISEELGGSHTKIEKNYRITPLNSDGSWTYCWYHIKTNSSSTRNIYIGITTGSSSVTTQMCLVRVDKWSESMGSNIEYDSSGFCNNGTRTGTFYWTSDCPKYSVSTEFNGTERIEADSLPSETQTIACWVNFFKVPSGYTIPVFDKNSKLAIGVSANARLITYIGTAAGGAGTQINTSFDTNKWYHIVVVKTGDNTRNVYINGELKPSGGGNWWGGDLDKLLIGCRHISGSYSSPFKGQLCDVRAYATALSADDVKSLYQNGAIIDANGTIHGQIR